MDPDLKTPMVTDTDPEKCYGSGSATLVESGKTEHLFTFDTIYS
jgi:hypothetical protein